MSWLVNRILLFGWGYVHFVVVGVMNFCFSWLPAFDVADVISLLSGQVGRARLERKVL